MQKGKINSKETQVPIMKVVTIPQDRKQIETEIDRHVKSIQSLIQRLGPPERQKYYNGLLSYLLAEEVTYPVTERKNIKSESMQHDYSRLSENDLSLIRELSTQINSLYNNIGDTMS